MQYHTVLCLSTMTLVEEDILKDVPQRKTRVKTNYG